MSTMQLDLFDETEKIIGPWSDIFPEWCGPYIGGIATVHHPIVRTINGGKIYAYMETVQFVDRSNDGLWVAKILTRIDWREERPKILLSTDEIWVPRNF